MWYALPYVPFNSIFFWILAHIFHLLSIHHILWEVRPDIFAINRISALLDSGKEVREVSIFFSSFSFLLFLVLSLLCPCLIQALLSRVFFPFFLTVKLRGFLFCLYRVVFRDADVLR